MIHIFTITARNYLSLAITLGDSLAVHHPEAKFTIFVADGLGGVDEQNIPHALKDVTTLLGTNLIDDLPFKYNITEFCTSVKPLIFQHLLASEPDTSLVYYIDPDIYLYSRLDVITESTPEKTLYLAPHLIDCKVIDDNPYPEYHHLWEGIFNLGFCAVRRTSASEKILAWWHQRLVEYCYADFKDGLHTDQKWMDYAPAYFEKDLQIVRNYGVNVAHWNLGERHISEKDGEIFSNTDRLVFFHFSGFDFRKGLLSKHSTEDRQAQHLHGTLAHVITTYRQKVIDNGYDKYLSIPYAYAKYDNGLPITSFHRRLYRAWSAEEKISSPESSSGVFYRRLEAKGLIDKSNQASSNYSAATVSNLDKKITQVEKALRILLKLAGPGRYVQFTKLFSRIGRFENHAFLLRDKEK